jgi:hypothetical protein
MYDSIPATHWQERLQRVMDWADELGATEEITPSMQMKYVQTMEEIHKIHLFLEGLELLLGDEKFGSLRQEGAQCMENASHRRDGSKE